MSMETSAYCTNCGQPTVATDNACRHCGQWLKRPAAMPMAPPPARSRLPLVVAGLAIGIVVLLIGILVASLLRNARSEKRPVAGAAAATPSPKATPTPRASPTAKPTDVDALPTGWFCRDLKARQYSYVAAVTYWHAHGQPNQMDTDRNGIPCETVYSRSDVASYWSGRDPAALPAMSTGLLCQDLARMGYDYAQAVSYWYWQGRANRMDADRNGIPCETVYPSGVIGDFWGAG